MPRFTKCFEIMVEATHGKNLGPPMPEQSDDSGLHENEESWTTCALSMTCQIDVVNKQLAPPLN